MPKILEKGVYGEYIEDLTRDGYKLERLCEIEERPAVIWVQETCRGKLHSGLLPFYDQFYKGLYQWINKGYYIVSDGENAECSFTALYKHDEKFWIYKIIQGE